MNERPLGITLVAILTLLSSGALFMLFTVSNLLLAVGGPYGGGGVDWFYVMIHYPALPISFILLVYAFFLSIGMFKLKTKYVWNASILFWLLLLLFFFWWGYGIWRNIGISYNEDGTSTWELVYGWQYEVVVVTLLPFAYSIGCLAYFQTQEIKQYFHL
jgi:hypothetical protein